MNQINLVSLAINNHRINALVDTGATVNILDETELSQIKHAKLQKTIATAFP